MGADVNKGNRQVWRSQTSCQYFISCHASLTFMSGSLCSERNTIVIFGQRAFFSLRTLSISWFSSLVDEQGRVSVRHCGYMDCLCNLLNCHCCAWQLHWKVPWTCRMDIVRYTLLATWATWTWWSFCWALVQTSLLQTKWAISNAYCFGTTRSCGLVVLQLKQALWNLTEKAVN